MGGSSQPRTAFGVRTISEIARKKTSSSSSSSLLLFSTCPNRRRRHRRGFGLHNGRNAALTPPKLNLTTKVLHWDMLEGVVELYLAPCTDRRSGCAMVEVVLVRVGGFG